MGSTTIILTPTIMPEKSCEGISIPPYNFPKTIGSVLLHACSKNYLHLRLFVKVVCLYLPGAGKFKIFQA
jgi:hypothetical protein